MSDERRHTATRNPAEFLGRGAWSGTVAPGRAADLLLLAANPLEDIGNVERRLGVMRAGRWHPQSELLALLQRQVAAQNR